MTLEVVSAAEMQKHVRQQTKARALGVASNTNIGIHTRAPVPWQPRHKKGCACVWGVNAPMVFVNEYVVHVQSSAQVMSTAIS